MRAVAARGGLALVVTALAAGAGCRGPEPSPAPAVEPPAAARPAPAPPPPAIADGPARREPPPAPQGQLDDYAAHRPKSVLELQPFRVQSEARVEDGAGRGGSAILTALNPRINDWFLLELAWDDGGRAFHHLENRDPAGTDVRLDPRYLHGLVLEDADGRQRCDLWSSGGAGSLAAAGGARGPYVPLCEGRLSLRRPAAGRKTAMEWATDFLRDNIWRGERITVFVRDRFYRDSFLETSELTAVDGAVAAGRARPAGAPARPRVDPRFEAAYLRPAELGLALEHEVPGQVLVGRWYRVRNVPGIFVSTIRPNLVAPEVVRELRGLLNPLEEIEEGSLVYLIGFDLAEFEVGFALGTEHPRVGWSDRVLPSVRDDRLPGPDGIGSVEPLVMTGMVNPADAERVAATFVGGFKRTHGAFRAGELATRNLGSHYGFIEHGAILSKLRPGLATAVVYADGAVDLKTWSEEDDRDLADIRHARQNGLPIIEPDPETGLPRPGELVPRWTLGNWSGSVDKRLRTLRAGLCLQESAEGRYLLYGYFSSVTPSAMARVFYAYGCRYAMLLDMNALEHTYLAVYHLDGERFLTQHLIEGMDVLDKSEAGQELPRFVGFADNRDFFYLLREAR